jgi:hypothetical protein
MSEPISIALSESKPTFLVMVVVDDLEDSELLSESTKRS